MSIQRLKALEEEMHKCFRCNLCKMIPLPVVRHSDYFDGCPAVREFEFHSYSGSGKQIMALSLISNRIHADARLAEIVNACTACGNCDVACKFIMDAERHRVNMALREHLVEEGLELPVHRQTIDNLKTHGHPFGKLETKAGAWADGLDIKWLPRDKADVLLFAGCMQRNDAYSAETARKLARLLIHAGVDVGILGDDEPSCGLPAYWTGYRDDFIRIGREAAARLDRTGVKTVVTVSGSCLGVFRSKYPEYMEAPKAEVLHATEFIWQLIQSGKLKLSKAVNRRATYHDPCYLGRQSEPPVQWKGESKLTHGCMTYFSPPKPINRGCKGVYDAPRNILKAIPGLDFREMYRIREYSYCCGGGGGVPAAYPEMAASAALHRMDEAREIGADLLVTACHECRLNLMKSDSRAGARLPVNDIIDLVFQAVNFS